MFLILRCRASDTLIQASLLREEADRLGYTDPMLDIRCPTYRTVRRVGRSRAREEQDTPLLGSFIFVRWKGDTYFANYIEDRFPFLGVMRLPHGGYAQCSEKELDAIGKELFIPIPALVEEDAPIVYWANGAEVCVNVGFMKGIKGIVKQTKPDGQVLLKVTSSAGWQLSTLLIHGSLLASECASSQEASGTACLTPPAH